MSILSRLASKAKNWLNRRTPAQGGTGARSSGGLQRGTGRNGEGLSETAVRAARQLTSNPPALTTHQYLRQMERIARGEALSDREIRAVARAQQAGGSAVLAPPVTPGFQPPIGPAPTPGKTTPPITPSGGQPPIVPPQPIPGQTGGPGPTGGKPPKETDDPEAFDDIITLGRDYSYDSEDHERLINETIQVSSSNVFGYYYQAESNYTGILYVTFLAPAPKGEQREGPGPTYAYYDVRRSKYRQFAADANSSPGGAVWDHLRVRGTLWGHQQRYRLISVVGEYIPRKATQRGYRERVLPPVGYPASQRSEWQPLPKGQAARRKELGRRGYRRSTLPERLFDSASPERGEPDRGTPDRG